MSLKDKIHLEKLPVHVAVIMDGNGRWAKKQGKNRTFGHQHGVKSVQEISEAAAEIGIKYLTLYAFSTENWNRPKYEVDVLMKLLVKTIEKETKTLKKNNIRLNAIGNLSELPSASYKQLMKSIDDTAENTRMTLTLALSYSSRWEIVNAVKKIAEKISTKDISADIINQELFSSFLNTNNMPDPELLIRTSGEQRISNFLLWQIAYAELYFTDTLWPDFRKEDLYKALIDFQGRERRFGKISEQINK